MKKILGIIIGSSFLFIAGCNSGTTSVTIPPATEYTFTSLSYYPNLGSSGCTVTGLFNFMCPTAFTEMSIDSLSYASSPSSYLVIPTSKPEGLTLLTSGTCQTSPVASFGSCTISFSANGVASGSVVNIPMNGSLGESSFITVTFQ